MTAEVVVVLTGGTIGQRGAADGARPDSDATERLVHASVPAGTSPRIVRAMQRDSPDVGPADWGDLARTIAASVTVDTVGVVVLHGTDTMAYTAAALAFALQNVRYPVVLTGSMVPGSDPGSDAPANLRAAMTVAGSAFRGVGVVFTSPDDETTADLLDGLHVVKTRTQGAAAFATPRHARLGVVRDGRVRLSPVVRDDRPVPTPPGEVAFDPRVDLVKVSPFTSADRLSRLLHGLRGVVIEGFGAGHVSAAQLEAIRDFGGIVVIGSQVSCDRERLGLYASDRRLTDLAHVVRAGPMTSTTALVKLSWALTRGTEVTPLMTADMVGELSRETPRETETTEGRRVV